MDTASWTLVAAAVVACLAAWAFGHGRKWEGLALTGNLGVLVSLLLESPLLTWVSIAGIFVILGLSSGRRRKSG